MLCSRCENQFCGHERVAERFLTDINQIQLQAHERSIRRSSLDYPSLKLFFLSVLWRCAVARDPMTRMVNLGPRLSKMTALLQANDPGRQEEFAIFLRLLDESPMARNAVLTVPVPMRDVSRRGYAMVGNGVEVSWVTDQQGCPTRAPPGYSKRTERGWLRSSRGLAPFHGVRQSPDPTNKTAARNPRHHG